MVLVTYIILLGLFNFSVAEDCLLNNVPEQIIWQKQLRKDLRCVYYLFDPPKPANNETLTVDVRFILKYFSFSSDEEVLTLQSWMFISWTDERLKWDPHKYGGVNETEVSSISIWTPSFLLFNNAETYDFDRFFYVRCSLKSTGEVLCVPKIVHGSKCSVSLTNFPYDVQECTVEYGPWDIKHRTFNMNVTSRAMRMLGAEYGSQWVISDYRQQSQIGTDRQLNMTFVLEREALSLAAVIVYPCLIISGLTIACMFLDVRSNVRLGLVCFSLYSHYFWLAEVGENIPKKTADLPRILLYYRGSTVLTALVLGITFVLEVVCRKITAPHNIIISINDFVYKSYARFLVNPRWDIEGIVMNDEDKIKEDWLKFANIVNSFCSTVILFAYIGMYVAFVPQPVPINY